MTSRKEGQIAPCLPWILKLLGGLCVRRETGEPVHINGLKDQALLGFLALSPGANHSRDRLASLLWSDHGDKQARDSLKQCLMRLRRSFGSAVPSPIRADRQAVTLDADLVSADVAAFEIELRDGSVQSLERAVGLYQGDLLEGLSVRDSAFEDWLLVERQRLRQLAVEALTKLMAQSLADGPRERATAAARRLLSLDPLHEAASRALMQWHAERHERAQALRLFETLRARLQQELGVEPEAETVVLHQSIRQQRRVPAKQLVETPGDDASVLAGTESRADRAATMERPSIAVLPFRNIGGDPEQECFADGLTEDIITDLSQVSALFVLARHTVFAFKDKAMPIQEAASALKVGYILEGSVRKAGNQVRITTQLADGATGGHLWAGRYDRSVDDIFALQDEISKSIVDVLRVKLLPGELDTISTRSTSSVEAYEYYLMGRSFYLRGIDKRSLTIARSMYAKAAEIDPCYARAYAGIATCESYLMMCDPVTTFESVLAKVERALELEPNLAEAYAVKGMVLYAAGHYAEAGVEFERAMALDPDLFEASFFYARNCRLQGKRQRAAELFQRAAELRPNNFRSLGLFAEECKALGRQEDFLSAARRCLERVTVEVTQHPDNADAWAFGGVMLAELGDAARSEHWAGRAVMIGPDDHLVHYNVARTYASLGKLEPAMDWLERALSAYPLFARRLAAWMAYDEGIAPLRDSQRYQALAQHHAPENAASVAAAR